MGTLVFKVDEKLRSIVQHARSSKEHRKTYGQQRAKAAIWLVHDAGVYLMSNGNPMQLDPQRQSGTAAVVQYARGCGPDQAGWERSRALVGGDDFCEPLDLAFFENAIAADCKEVRINVTANSLSMEAS